MAKSPTPVKEFTFKYVKTADFKTVYANGIYGGLTITNDININFFTDIVELPKLVAHKVDPQGKIGKEVIPPTPLPSSIREIGAGVNMNLTVAKSFVLWLNQNIKEAEDRMKLFDNPISE